MNLNETYWASRYREDETGWDLNRISPPLKEFIDQLEDKTIKILIPGAGNAYEAEYLFSKGFEQVHVLDIAREPLENLKLRVPSFPEENLHNVDFFKFHDTFDLILEQTFFCALPIEKRNLYAKKMTSLLKNNGKLVGLFFNMEFKKKGPPFGGNKEEYLTYFGTEFNIEILENCTNSIPPRQGNELFFIFKKN
ncbi:methyltransferase domain-containing protein [Gillisia limnaea]|uniref:Thiopurine S-methyltransferase n=1 Tax=Gillisia limnaea (strain DSM 15749 / LMG 21470 / R-8282) TaxID=865937 RepID=H2C075_GILLR|nr:methyltransferase domain-containing protein [Gillisia limnaea]EHQ03491.1 thiopurine S-methyltransferase [Gillisia limnaea DSM 15749]